MKTYLCGPINGCTDAQAKDWRDYAKTKLTGETLDPMRRDYRGREAENFVQIVNCDLNDISNCRALLVNAPQPSWGTAMEIFYAKTQGKRVATVVPAGTRVSPWLQYYSDSIFNSLDDAIAYLNEKNHLDEMAAAAL